MAARLESRVKSLLRAGHAAPGRGTILSLDEGIEEIRQRLNAAGIYEAGYGSREVAPEEFAALGTADNSRCGVVRLDANLIDLPKQGATLDAAAWMTGDLREAYLWPTAYAESGGIGTQSTEQGSEIAPKQTDEIAANGFQLTAREERELSVRLDGAGMLRLVPESEARELANILTVRKSWDAAKKVWRLRLLFDRRRRNSVERQLPTDAMLALAQGPDLCEIILLPTEELRFDSSDLDNWYYQFDVSADRAATNVYGKPRPLSEFQGLRAAAGLQTHGETAQQIRYCAALGSMAMGDHNACEFGQSVHLAVLRASGCARESELLRLREPVPRGDLVEGIVIDDHGLVYKIPRGRRYGRARRSARRRDTGSGVARLRRRWDSSQREEDYRWSKHRRTLGSRDPRARRTSRSSASASRGSRGTYG